MANNHDERLRQLELSMHALQQSFTNHEKWAGERKSELDKTAALLADIKLEIHSAKLAGKVALGIMLTLGGVVGWLIGLLMRK